MSKARDLAGIFNLGPRSGTTAQRPSTAEVGDIFYNGTTGKTEIYTTTGWQEMASGIPFGNTAGRPAAVTGQPYFNGETQRLEMYTAGGSWENIVQEVPGVASISGNYSEQTDSGAITIYGTNFVNGAYATAIGTNGVQINATSTVYNSLVQLTATFSGLSNANEPYDIKVTNPSNLFGIIPDALYVNASPVWITNSGSLGTFDEQVSISVSATGTDSDSTIAYSLSNGSSLPSGVSLNSSTGLISGTLPNITSDTTYNFTINASDGVNTIPRSFSITSLAVIASEVLVVAGGGGSGGTCNDAWYPGSGGAGGYRTSTSLQFRPSTQYAVTVGLGGGAGTGGTTVNSTRGLNGGNSSVAHRLGLFAATGGGGGAAAQCTGSNFAQSGGSGGGGGSTQSNLQAGGAGNSGGYNPVEGYSGANGLNGGTGHAGSGGGSSGPGTTMSSATGSNVSGGSGTSNSITGSPVTYATGGSILMNTVSLGTATPNTGNGANSGALNPSASPSNGAAGASGVVVIKVPTQAATTTGNPVYSTSGGFHIYKFNNDGSITF
jgi:hypothetical protein